MNVDQLILDLNAVEWQKFFGVEVIIEKVLLEKSPLDDRFRSFSITNYQNSVDQWTNIPNQEVPFFHVIPTHNVISKKYITSNILAEIKEEIRKDLKNFSHHKNGYHGARHVAISKYGFFIHSVNGNEIKYYKLSNGRSSWNFANVITNGWY